jgi:hypothetical protein
MFFVKFETAAIHVRDRKQTYKLYLTVGMPSSSSKYVINTRSVRMKIHFSSKAGFMVST